MKTHRSPILDDDSMVFEGHIGGFSTFFSLKSQFHSVKNDLHKNGMRIPVV